MAYDVRDNAICIRLLRPGFQWGYPVGDFKHCDALYCASEDAVFLVTKQCVANRGDNIYPELAVWLPEEIRLLSALTLSVPEGHGWVAFTPWHRDTLPNVPLCQDISLDSIIETCRVSAMKLLAENEKGNRIPYVLRSVNRSDAETEKALFENIDIRDGLLLRGLYTLMKSALLIQDSSYFMEEALMNLQISREAALQAVREHLCYTGNPSPSYRDAYDYVRSHFHLGEPLAEYLESQHESWVETKHPESSYGAEWAPSLYVEDVFDMYGCLISLYRHIIIDEPGRASLQP